MVDNYREYTEIIFKNLLDLKKGDSLFISIDIYNRKIMEYLTYMAYEYGIEDIMIETNQIYSSSYDEYRKKGAKMLFFSNSKINTEYYRNSFTAVLPNKELIDLLKSTNKEIFEEIFYKTNSIHENSYIKNNIEISKYKKIARNLNNLKISHLYLDALKETEISMIKPTFRANSNNDIIKTGLEISSSNISGTIVSNKQSFIGNERIDELILMIKDNKIIDFDCKTNKEILKKLSLELRFNKIMLNKIQDSSYDLYRETGNYILDKYSCPYLSMTTNKEELIIPIANKTLSLDAYNGKFKRIYEKEKFRK